MFFANKTMIFLLLYSRSEITVLVSTYCIYLKYLKEEPSSFASLFFEWLVRHKEIH